MMSLNHFHSAHCKKSIAFSVWNPNNSFSLSTKACDHRYAVILIKSLITVAFLLDLKKKKLKLLAQREIHFQFQTKKMVKRLSYRDQRNCPLTWLGINYHKISSAYKWKQHEFRKVKLKWALSAIEECSPLGPNTPFGHKIYRSGSHFSKQFGNISW